MSDLALIDRRKFERFFEMEGGYVCDFSNKTFQDFVLDVTGVDVYAKGYDENGESKANRLRLFLRRESNFLTSKLLEEMLSYQQDQKEHLNGGLSKAEQNLLTECRGITEKLKNNSEVEDSDILESNLEGLGKQSLIESIREGISKNKPEEVLDRMHTFMMRYVRSLLNKHGVEYKKEDRLTTLFKKYTKCIKEKGAFQSKMTERIINSLMSTLDTFDSVRNNQSLAHDNALLGRSESALLLSHICGVIKFIQATEKQIEAKEEAFDYSSMHQEFTDEEIEAAGDAWIQHEIDIMRGK